MAFDNPSLLLLFVFLFLPRRGRAGIRHSGMNAQLGQDVAVEYEPDHSNQDDDEQFFHSFPPFLAT
jgi:hypothetical protein